MATKRKQRERAVMEIMAEGKVVLMSEAEEKKWRKSIKTVMRDKQLPKEPR